MVYVIGGPQHVNVMKIIYQLIVTLLLKIVQYNYVIVMDSVYMINNLKMQLVNVIQNIKDNIVINVI